MISIKAPGILRLSGMFVCGGRISASAVSGSVWDFELPAIRRADRLRREPTRLCPHADARPSNPRRPPNLAKPGKRPMKGAFFAGACHQVRQLGKRVRD